MSYESLPNVNTANRKWSRIAPQPLHPSRVHDQGTADDFFSKWKFQSKEPNGARDAWCIRVRYRAAHPDGLASDPTISSTTWRVTIYQSTPSSIIVPSLASKNPLVSSEADITTSRVIIPPCPHLRHLNELTSFEVKKVRRSEKTHNPTCWTPRTCF